MKVILINPSSKLAETNRRYRRFIYPHPPMGIASIAAVLEKRGIEVILLDQYANRMSSKELLEKIKEEMPQIVGFSCLTSVMSNVRAIINQIKALPGNIQIVLGNIHPTMFADELLKEGVADIVVRGEGEYSMREVAAAFENRRGLQSIKGISYLQEGEVYHNPEREVIKDLSELPYPSWHLLNLRDYRSAPLLCIYDLVLPVQASRGCAYRCTYCSQDKVYAKPRYRENKEVIDEIEYLHNKFNIRYFGFYDAYFPFSIKQGLEFCDEFIRRGLPKKLRWVIETRVDKVDLKLLKRMKEAGLHLIMYGFEVGNEKILTSLKKMTTIEQARRAVEYTKKANILTVGFFILGMPGETKETCEETIKFAKELDCDIAKFNTAVPYPGSKFFEDYKAQLSDSIKQPEKFTSWYDWSSFSGSLIYAPEGMTSRELINLQRQGMFQYYARPQIILRHIRHRTIPFKNLYYGAFALMSGYLKALIDRFRWWIMSLKKNGKQI